MTTTDQPADLDHVDALCAAASPGNWVRGEHWVYRYPGVGDPPCLITIASEVEHQADAELIAEAQTLLPQMAAELREIRPLAAEWRRADIMLAENGTPRDGATLWERIVQSTNDLRIEFAETVTAKITAEVARDAAYAALRQLAAHIASEEGEGAMWAVLGDYRGAYDLAAQTGRRQHRDV